MAAPRSIRQSQHYHRTYGGRVPTALDRFMGYVDPTTMRYHEMEYAVRKRRSTLRTACWGTAILCVLSGAFPLLPILAIGIADGPSLTRRLTLADEMRRRDAAAAPLALTQPLELR